ncbi:M12 family metallo-peptidase [uncultured Shewanella sp.]|uniref:M12 family metallo-peptidase n=1 Tax=uncultured Shewanella sp. TaxID=173975 RepID=UPI0026171B0D|nr:M12 family metallo-peptidase [uncultured Shewanella sp.]
MINVITKKALLGLSISALMSTSALATDVIVGAYYTPDAASRSFDIQAEISNMVATANQYYANSGLSINLKLSATPYGLDQNIIASTASLRSIYRDSTIRNWRDEYKEDFVVVFGSYAPAGNGFVTCGIAGDIYGMKIFPFDYSNYDSYAFNVTGTNCGNTTMTFIHELGHNMGLGHSVKQGAVGGVYDYGVGYGVDYEFSTIMGYPHEFNTTNQLAVFSDPDRTCTSGYACGRSDADAQKALSLVTNAIAAFR